MDETQKPAEGPKQATPQMGQPMMPGSRIEQPARSVDLGAPGDYRLMFHEQPVHLEDLTIEKVTLTGLVNFIKARAKMIKERADVCMLVLQAETSNIDFTIQEHGGFTQHERGGASFYNPKTKLMASANISKDAQEVGKIMNDGYASPHALGLLLKNKSHLFASEAEYQRVVLALRNTELTVKRVVQESSTDTGDRVSSFNQKLENIPELRWEFHYNLLDGEDTKITLPVLVTYSANQSVSGVDVKVFSHLRIMMERDIRKKLMDKVVADIKVILGVDTTVPFVYVSE